MGDYSDPESSHNLLEKDTTKPSSHHQPHHHHYANTAAATSSQPANGDPALSQPKPDSGNVMANKSYPSSANGGGGGGPSVALNYSPDSHSRLQRKVAKLTNYLYGLVVVVIVGGLILICTVASLYAKLHYDLRNHSHQPKVGEQISKILEREELCVPCSEVRLGPSPEEEAMLNVFTKRDSREGQKCCVERPAELLRLLELVSAVCVR